MILITLTLLAAAAAAPRSETATVCLDPGVQRIKDDGAALKRLDQLPRAETYLAVLHRDNGCTRPILAREYRQGAGEGR